eukprot:358132-Chlamydomonas_euryale.AAC.1
MFTLEERPVGLSCSTFEGLPRSVLPALARGDAGLRRPQRPVRAADCCGGSGVEFRRLSSFCCRSSSALVPHVKDLDLRGGSLWLSGACLLPPSNPRTI